MQRLIKKTPEVNSGTMADVAFLLLVFFLVSTTIHNDYGISSTISKPYAVPDSISIVQSNLIINRAGQLLLGSNQVNFESLSTEIASGFDKRKTVKNVLVVKTEREVEYSLFIKTLNESKKAFKLFYNELSQENFNSEFQQLNDSSKWIIQKFHPIALAEDVIEL